MIDVARVLKSIPLGWSWVDLLVFEHLCPGCQQPVSAGNGADNAGKGFWCEHCLQKLLANPESCCGRCSAELPTASSDRKACKLCRGVEWRFDQVISVGNYHSDLSELVVRMKGLRDRTLAWQLGILLGERLLQRKENSKYDLIVPLPGWWSRRYLRGFDGAGRIAAAIKSVIGVPICNRILRCCRKTAKQGTLSISARFRNVAGMFEVNKTGYFAGQRILLVDDVLTSGATASQAASVMKRRGGADRVDVAVLARGTRGV